MDDDHGWSLESMQEFKSVYWEMDGGILFNGNALEESKSNGQGCEGCEGYGGVVAPRFLHHDAHQACADMDRVTSFPFTWSRTKEVKC